MSKYMPYTKNIPFTASKILETRVTEISTAMGR